MHLRPSNWVIRVCFAPLFRGNRTPFGGDTGVWKLAFLTFFALWRPFSRKQVVRISPNWYIWQISISALTCQEKLKIVSSEVGRKCEKPRNMGFGAVWGSPPYGAHTPIWPVRVIALMALRKTVFILGESAPIWGRYGVLKFSKLLSLSPVWQNRYRKLDVSSRFTDRKCSGRLSICGAPPRLRTCRVSRSSRYSGHDGRVRCMLLRDTTVSFTCPQKT